MDSKDGVLVAGRILESGGGLNWSSGSLVSEIGYGRI